MKKTGVERDLNVRYGGLVYGHSDGDFYFHAGRISPEYTAADRKAWDDGSAFTMATMWPQLADISFTRVTKVDVPVVFLLGRHDTTVPAEIAARWFDRVRAPSKSLVWFENSAHLPIIEEPGHTLEALITRVRPLATDPR